MMNRRITWAFFVLLLARYGLQWTRLATGWPVPTFGSIGSTLAFAGFSLAHAIDLLGWRRAVTFFGLSAAISWCFEQAGVATGLVYGAYHYSDKLGPKVGAVPIIIPLAWFMMIYCAWIVAHVLLDGTSSPRSRGGMAARSLVAAMAITSWDVVMDPSMARAGNWIWENGGSYFGVPMQNYVGFVWSTPSESFSLPSSQSCGSQRCLGRLPICHKVVQRKAVWLARRPFLSFGRSPSVPLSFAIPSARIEP